MISVDDFYNLPKPNLKPITSGNVDQFLTQEKQGRQLSHRADLLMHRIVTDRIRKHVQLIEQGNGETVNTEKLYQFATFVSPDVADYVNEAINKE